MRHFFLAAIDNQQKYCRCFVVPISSLTSGVSFSQVGNDTRTALVKYYVFIRIKTLHFIFISLFFNNKQWVEDGFVCFVFINFKCDFKY
ncbi:hypothetical protein Dda3937_03658 [Dickeya dadantii 3937]|uniref:Uncharacterized protein n=1 Tax=Dickeya dadantii (strain 3937) TaxID=198628 RepID=E0SGX2_DICD3|nr:hypothetical protein Dda3937_03658 [Dickeya dadantii 3937]